MNKIALQAFQESFDNTLALLENGEVETSPAIEKMASAYDIGIEGEETSYESLLAKLAAKKYVPVSKNPWLDRNSSLKIKTMFNDKSLKGRAKTVATAVGHGLGKARDAVSSAAKSTGAYVSSAAKATGKHIMRNKVPYGIGAGLAAAGGLAYGAHRLMKKDDDKD